MDAVSYTAQWIAVLGMLMSVEEATGISVDPEGLDIDDLRTLGSFADYVEAAIRKEEIHKEEGTS
ncbi:Acyl carrier protein OS=Streptomyces cyaneofuscatus OX=66883 GN=G3I52_18710 PE=4 SV=1 [Streptomyces cyaneofuscatus]